ncbi:MAG: DUF389 domain-containing protein [Prevotellaceae bacterium]|nr:DUF389 domain-containing protein [Prevotellaceae bacterium]
MDIKKYFILADDLCAREEAIESIEKNATFRGASVWILIFAIFIASLGLNVNSTAVIIGAMLVSPLMGPIIGMGLAVGINDFGLLSRALRNYLVATVVAVLTATVYFLVSPLQDTGSELLARTSPTLYDVLIAFMGGAAGILALCVREKGNVLPGVAIATALMPPLCTAGFGLAQGNMGYFLGAFFLYFINTVFIALATLLGVKLMKLPSRKYIDAARKKLVHRSLVLVVVATMIPAAIMTWSIVKKSYFDNQVQTFVRQQLNWEGTQVLTQDVGADSTLRVVVVGRTVSEANIEAANKAITAYPLLRGYSVKVLQGNESDSLMALRGIITNVSEVQKKSHELIRKEAEENERLTEQIRDYERWENKAREMAPDARLFFPSVTSLSLSSTLQVSTQPDAEPLRLTTAIVTVEAGSLAEAEKEKMEQWLRQRSGADSLQIVYVAAEPKPYKEAE